MSTTVEDHFSDVSDFEDLLFQAGSNAATKWEESFTEEIQERFDQYRSAMFLSEAQLKLLNTIAGA